MMEIYSSKIRAESRASILNTQDRGWIVVNLENGFGVTHDGSKPQEPKATFRWCLEKPQPYKRATMILKSQ